MTYAAPNRTRLEPPSALYLLGQSQQVPADRSTQWVVVTADREVAMGEVEREWGGQGPGDASRHPHHLDALDALDVFMAKVNNNQSKQM